MGERMSWQDALMRLHVGGWDTDEIDAACEALVEACEEGGAEGFTLDALTTDQVDDILDVDVIATEVPALLTIARVRSSSGTEARALRDALYDLDAFAYAYSGDD
jgi:hypothetical protein